MTYIRPVSDLRNKFPEIENLANSGDPIFLTKNGCGSLVVMNLECYDNMVAELKEARLLNAALKDVEENKLVDGPMTVANLKDKYGLK